MLMTQTTNGGSFNHLNRGTSGSNYLKFINNNGKKESLSSRTDVKKRADTVILGPLNTSAFPFSGGQNKISNPSHPYLTGGDH